MSGLLSVRQDTLKDVRFVGCVGLEKEEMEMLRDYCVSTDMTWEGFFSDDEDDEDIVEEEDYDIDDEDEEDEEEDEANA